MGIYKTHDVTKTIIINPNAMMEKIYKKMEARESKRQIEEQDAPPTQSRQPFSQVVQDRIDVAAS